MLITSCSIHLYWASSILFTAIESFTSARRCCIWGPCALNSGTTTALSARTTDPSDASRIVVLSNRLVLFIVLLRVLPNQTRKPAIFLIHPIRGDPARLSVPGEGHLGKYLRREM